MSNQKHDSSIKPEILREIAAEGGLAEVDDVLLRRLRLVRLYDPVRRMYHVMTSKYYGDLVARCLRVKELYRGYIFSDSLNRINGLCGRRQVITEDELSVVAGRAHAMIAAGIPPIFDEAFYMHGTYTDFIRAPGGKSRVEVRYESRFPSIDFIIQYGSGNFERNRARMAANMRERGGKKVPIAMTSVEDVLDFRRLAFAADGRIDPMLVADTMAHVRDRFDFKKDEHREWVVEHNALVFPMLEEMLGRLPGVPPSYEEWDGDAAIVLQPRWYLRFRPERRESIARRFVETLTTPLKGPRERAFERLAVLYPDMCSGVAELLKHRLVTEGIAAVEVQIAAAVESGDFRRLPTCAFCVEPWRGSFLPVFEERYRRACMELGADRPELLMSNAQFIDVHLKMPARISLVPRYKRILDEVRLETLKRIGDKSFTDLFVHATNRSWWAGLGHSKCRETDTAGASLRAYIMARRRAVLDGSQPAAATV